MNFLRLFLTTVLSAAFAIANGQGISSVSGAALPKFQLTGDSISFNFLAQRLQYIFIEGSVGLVKGKFMFDTGSEDALVINSLYVPLTGGKKLDQDLMGAAKNIPSSNWIPSTM